ncbi:MAG: hypothetical protein JXB10_03360 [Pirellulales bacterium]|nr:hypothetical protein [Pirellulales bacterium]
MTDPAVKRSGWVGGVIVFLITFIPSVGSCSWDSRVAIQESVGFLLLIFFVSLLTGLFGSLLGRFGANQVKISKAFIMGGVISSLVPVIGFLISAILDWDWLFVFLGLLVIFLCFSAGSLISGIGAIIARDYRRFQRGRFFPQFTLMELLIVITLVAVMCSMIISL